MNFNDQISQQIGFRRTVMAMTKECGGVKAVDGLAGCREMWTVIFLCLFPL